MRADDERARLERLRRFQEEEEKVVEWPEPRDDPDEEPAEPWARDRDRDE